MKGLPKENGNQHRDGSVSVHIDNEHTEEGGGDDKTKQDARPRTRAGKAFGGLTSVLASRQPNAPITKVTPKVASGATVIERKELASGIMSSGLTSTKKKGGR